MNRKERSGGAVASGVGLTLGLHGAGMVAGAWAAPGLGRRLAFGTMIAIGPLCGVIAACLLLATLRYPSIGLVGLGFFLFGAEASLAVAAAGFLAQSWCSPCRPYRASTRCRRMLDVALPRSAGEGACGETWAASLKARG